VTRRYRTLAAAVTVALTITPAVASADDDDSPWPDSGSAAVQVRAVRNVVAELERKVELMEWSAARYADWEGCLHGVPVSEYGDPDRQFGYAYDERDGTGLGHMPALAVDRRSRDGKEDYLFLDFGSSSDCRSRPPLPGGTAEPASVAQVAHLTSTPDPTSKLRDLERRVRRLKRSARRLSAASERFDEWESCVSWVPVTEYGDPDGAFGYLFKGARTPGWNYRPALAIDRSDWDDPDYMFLAFVGGDRPGHTCQNEPGEAVD